MATTPNFIQSTVSGTGTGNWTSLQFGPDQRLYASKVDGTIAAFTITATSSGYQVAAGGVETINLIKDITNYNDDGTLAPTTVQGSRQVTGILVTAGPGATVAAPNASTAPLAETSSANDSALVASSDPKGLPPGLVDNPGQPSLRVPAPIATSILQRAPIGTQVADVNATSTDGGPITYSLHPGRPGGNGAFAIDASTGVITVADPSKLNAGVRGQGFYELSVRVSDGQETSKVKVSVGVVESIAREPTGPIETAAALEPTDTAVVIYVSSSDPRIGAGPDGGDVNLDTNSGVISRLTQRSDGGWDRIDLVRGLPRSEENHSVNGMQLSADGKTLYVAVGGNTNQGAPSNNFAYTPEYAYSAALLSIDLAAVEAMPTQTDQFGNSYKYNLPTLPAASADPYKMDPFGGQDGLSQAKIVTGGPVQIYSPGYRNPYDIVLTRGGKLYTIDNGANAGWGGLPIGEGTANVTNAPNNGGSDTTDHLHLVTQGFYGGHPNPIRANPNGAGWYLNGSTTPVASLPQGWPPVSAANPVESDFRFPNQDGSLYSNWFASTNGLAEYTSSTFEGAMTGALVAVSWDDQLYRIDLDKAGTIVTGVTKITNGTSVLGGGLPLDVTAQGDDQTFPGTIWVANYGGGITVFTPSDVPPPPPSGDADGDGLSDSVDRFAEDPANGKNTDLAAGQSLIWNFSQNIDPPGPNALFNMGFTGLMSNNSNSYLTHFDPANIKAGGAAAGFQVEAVSEGDAIKNSQANGFQFGIDVQPDVGQFVIETKMDNPFGGSPSTTPVNYKSQGFYIGTGDQDNYVKIVAAANGGSGGIQVGVENAGAFSGKIYPAGITGAGIQTLDTLTLRLAVDVGTGIATPNWTYTVGGTAFNGSGTPVQLSGATLNALRGAYAVGSTSSALAVGIISTSYLSGEAFPAFWESIKITATNTAPAAGVKVTQTGGSTAATEGGATDTFTVALNSPPAANVTISVNGTADVTGSPTTLTFTPGNWSTAQTVTVTAVNDTLVEGPETANITLAATSSDASYNGISIAPVSVALTDNDTAAPGNIALNAGGAAFSAGNGTPYLADQYFSGGNTFATTAAIANTTDDALYQNERYGGSFGYAIPLANGSYSVTLQFAENYFDASGKRVFDVTAEGSLVIDNLDIWSAAGNQKNAAYNVTVPVSVQDGVLNLQFASSINNAKIDAIRVVPASGGTPAGVKVTQTGGSTAATEGGATDTFTVALNSPPAANVTISVNGTADVTGSPTTLTFTPGNWSTAQTVTVTAVNDTLVEGPETANITLAATSSDASYNGISIAPVSVALTDDDQSPTQGAQARLSITPSGALTASTFTSGAFKLENLSTAGQEITSVTIDLSGSILAGMVFDPAGMAGDTTAKSFTVDGKVGSFSVAGATFSDGSDATGYKKLSLQLQGFGPGETLSFSADVDPTSIKGVASPGPSQAGNVAGVELTGAEATFNFGATTLTNELFKVPTGTGGGTVLASMPPLAAPTVTVQGVSGTTATVNSAQQTVSVSGPAGTTARVLLMEGGAFKAGVPATAPQLGPYEANSAVAASTYDVALNGQGRGQVVVTLTDSVPEGGINFITASILSAGGGTSPASTPLVLKLEASSSTPVVVDSSAGLTGALGAQNWGPLDVSALNWSGAAALVTKTADGIGVQGGRLSEQVNFSPAGKVTELLRLDFDRGVENATVRLARMNATENGASGPEIGLWKAYDASGSLVGQGTFDPRQGTGAGTSAFDFLIDPAADFTRLDLTAVPYPNEISSTGDSSDFSLQRVAYQTDFVI
ncbi:malectin domain-containing carbohydrate-binding protein [Microvirga soli]|uniref:malectin domain-containing carbohydrate-binding protein n=1 Tax=Microvirga soli TaxID=1854496 RepID=UPI00191CB49F|nr:malectin domain-containing carbohydrate-binding protein [Microvirga soli]